MSDYPDEYKEVKHPTNDCPNEYEFRCDDCDRCFTLEGIAYLGPENPLSTECSPFMIMITLCYACKQKRDEEDGTKP